MNLNLIKKFAVLGLMLAVPVQVVFAAVNSEVAVEFAAEQMAEWFQSSIMAANPEDLVKKIDGSSFDVYQHFALMVHALMERANPTLGLVDMTQIMVKSKIGQSLLETVDIIDSAFLDVPEKMKVLKSAVNFAIEIICSKDWGALEGGLPKEVFKKLAQYEPVADLVEDYKGPHEDSPVQLLDFEQLF